MSIKTHKNLSNNWLREKISSVIALIRRSYIYGKFNLLKTNKIIKSKITQKNIYIIGTTSHSNLGDHAISLAEVLYIKKYFPEYELIEIPDKLVYKYLFAIKKNICSDDIIFLHGGGNVGIEYKEHEIIRRKTIKLFPNNRVAIFPQTFDFGNKKESKKELYLSMSIYNKHPRLLFMLREKYSYEIALNYLNKNIPVLIPDIVLSLNHIDLSSKKTNVYLCLRNDAEAITPSLAKKDIVDILKEKNEKVELIDTLHFEEFGPEKRDAILNDFWMKLSTAKLVITDRLHGMVFCHLLGIPCVVLPNYNNKVKGTYEWISENKNIHFFENSLDAIDYIRKNDFNEVNPNHLVDLTQYYDYSAELIRRL